MNYQIDYHVHTSYSADSKAPIEDMIQQAIEFGINEICITEHMDIDYPGDIDFTVDYTHIFPKMRHLQEKYKGKILIKTGCELGLMPNIKAKLNDFVHTYPFDYVIGSTHVVGGLDPYDGVYYENKSRKESYEGYFQEVYDNIKDNYAFDCVGHLDYIIRYYPGNPQQLIYSDFQEFIREIFKLIIRQGQGIEVNTSGYRKNLQQTHPHYNAITDYYQLGGEIITLGSDAHTPADIGYGIKNQIRILKTIGFKNITTFEARKPIFHQI